jgi:hypothetical protein
MITKIEGKCQYEGCDLDAEFIAAGRPHRAESGHPVGVYCATHADKVADEGHPEYNDECPNCGCHFGVN